MNLLAPLFLLGLGLIALPIWLHRLQTQTPKRQRFSSAMLLEQAEQRVHVQKKLRYWVLLALRILLLMLLALAFAKPVWERPPQVVAGPEAKLHSIVLDRSLSMSAGERMASARQKTLALLDAMSAGDRAQIVLADDALEVAVGPLAGTSDGKAALMQAVQAALAGAGQLNLGALVRGLEGLVADEPRPVVAHLIGDFQASGLPAQFADLVPRRVNGRAITLAFEPVAAAPTANWSVQEVRNTRAGIEVAVRGWHTPARDLTVALQVNGAEKARLTRPVPENGEAVFVFAGVGLSTGENRVAATVLSGDSLAGDDTYYAVIDHGAAQTVPLLTLDPKALPAKYLATAFTAADERYRIEPLALGTFDARTLQRHALVLVEDLGAVDAAQSQALRAYVQAGGAVFAAIGERSAALQRLPVTEQRVLAVRSAPDSGEPLRIGSVERAHALLARLEGWRGIQLTRLLALQTERDDRVLVALEDGTPLLIERRIGEGKLLLFASSLDNTWNDFPVQPVFVGFMAEVAQYLSGRDVLPRRQRVGANLSLAEAGRIGQVIDPQGRKLLALADAVQAEEPKRSVKLPQAGFYQVYTASGEHWLAANIDPLESDLNPVDEETMQRWRTAAAASMGGTAATNEAAPAAPQTAPLELWHVLLVLLALAVLAESLWGNRYVFRGLDGSSGPRQETP